MFPFIVKAGISGVIAALVAEIARRYPGWGGLVASLPLTSILAMIWLWRDGVPAAQIADFSSSIFWLVLPSLLLFIVMPLMLRAGYGFWSSLGAGCALTVLGYAIGLYALRLWTQG